MTIASGHLTSLLIPSQLPRYIRDDPTYATFVAFLQAYYEWMELNGGVTDGTKNLLSYKDIDLTTTQFLDYFVNDFLPYFPEDALVSKQRAIKFAKQLYESKGTPGSYQFLFRVLYNSDCDVFNTSDAVLKASDGVWYIPRSLNLLTTDPNWLTIANLRLFGLTSKSIATVEATVFDGIKTEVFISDIERLFSSGESVMVVDNSNQPVLFNGNTLVAKIVGQISQINIDPKNRGSLYKTGDPVVIYGGLSSNTGIGAKAVVGVTTLGSIQRIDVVNGGYGYQLPPNSAMILTNAPGAAAHISAINPAAASTANVGWIPANVISLRRFQVIGNGVWTYANTVYNGNTVYTYPGTANASVAGISYGFSNLASSNANTAMWVGLSFETLSTYPISTVAVDNGGGGISVAPTATAISLYPTEVNSTSTIGNLSALGILAPIQIISGGAGYSNGSQIIFTGGGPGFGANAIVTNIDANGAITGTGYVKFNSTSDYPLGGMGYQLGILPNVSATGSNTNTAILAVTQTLGNGALFNLSTNRVGEIYSITILNYGQDYITAPNVSLIVQDIAVSNVDLYNLPQSQTVVYQGANVAYSSYSAFVDSISLVSSDANPQNSIYNLRVFNYTGSVNPGLQLKSNNDTNIVYTVRIGGTYGANGVITYGDGTAKATSSFLNGLTIGQGSYISTRGQLSSFSILQSEIYNNYTYRLVVEKEISKYRDLLKNLLHPTGMNIVGVYDMRSNSKVSVYMESANTGGYTLSHWSPTGTVSVGTSKVFVPSSNNYLLYSQNFNQFWSPILGATVSPTPVLAPDGTYTANTITLTNNNGNRFEQSSAQTTVIGVKVTASVWLKGNGKVNFAATTTTGVDSSEITITLSDTWTRYYTSMTPGNAGVSLRMMIIYRSGQDTANLSFNAWGAQYEVGNLSPYIATTGSFGYRANSFIFSDTPSTNIIQFNNLGAVNIANVVLVNNAILISEANGYSISGSVLSVNSSSNTVTINSNTWVIVPNAAYVTANSGTNVININYLSESYIPTNQMTSNTSYPLLDLVHVGDYVNIASNPIQVVTNVNPYNNTITVQNTWSISTTSFMSVNKTLVANSSSVQIMNQNPVIMI
jgi:hypothetical protein